MADPINTMVSGDLLGGVIEVYTNIMGDWFFAIILGAMITLVYYKTKNVTMTSIMLMLLGGGLSYYDKLPIEASYGFYVIIALSMTGILYGVWKSTRE